MKKFLSGFLCCAILFGLSVSTLAASGRWTIEVNSARLLVNGEEFQPKNAKGGPVEIFNYNGTIYAPVRALAEVYGLEVGWDAEKSIATVQDPAMKQPEESGTPDTIDQPDYLSWSAEDEAAYQEFKGLWEVKPRKGYEYVKSDIAYPNSDITDGMTESYTLTYVGNLSRKEISAAVDQAYEKGFTKRLASEIQSHGAPVIIWFYYNEEKYENWCGWYDGRFN